MENKNNKESKKKTKLNYGEKKIKVYSYNESKRMDTQQRKKNKKLKQKLKKKY